MLEAQVAYYLNQYLGEYLSGLDTNSLQISVFAGDVTLTNLLLKPDALNALNLPVRVTAGLLGRLSLKVRRARFSLPSASVGTMGTWQVSWTQLGSVPVEVEMDQLYILVQPNDTAQAPTPKTPEAQVCQAYPKLQF